MTTPRLADLYDVAEVARASGVAAAFIESYASAVDQSSYYDRLKIPKRGPRRAGKFRVVFRAHDESLSELHRAVAKMITDAVTFGAHVQGFIGKRSIRTNAEQHLGARAVLRTDIKDFFDAIGTSHVRTALLSLGAPAATADLLARACTIDGWVRQGTRCGPALANLVCRQLDADLLMLASAHRCVYTRYADDLAFSGDKTPKVQAVEAVLSQHGFELHDKKCSVRHRGQAQFVTGLHVGDLVQPRLPRLLKRRLRLILHYVEKFGMDGHFQHPGKTNVADDPVSLAGMLRFVQSIEPALALKLRNQYRTGSRKSFFERAAQEEQDTGSSVI